MYELVVLLRNAAHDTCQTSSGGKSKRTRLAQQRCDATRDARCLLTLDLAFGFATGGLFGESTEGTSTRFGVEAVGILGIAGGRMCGIVSGTRIFVLSEN